MKRSSHLSVTDHPLPMLPFDRPRQATTERTLCSLSQPLVLSHIYCGFHEHHQPLDLCPTGPDRGFQEYSEWLAVQRIPRNCDEGVRRGSIVRPLSLSSD